MRGEMETGRLRFMCAEASDAELVQSYFVENREFLKEWEPERDDCYFERPAVEKMIADGQKEIEAGKALLYYLFLKSDDRLIGTISVTNIVHGVFQSAFLGYRLSERYCNHGYMTEALKKVVETAFVQNGLHRLEANILPRNVRSRRVLEKAGFVREGMSPKYLKINGVWEDHEHYVIRDLTKE